MDDIAIVEKAKAAPRTVTTWQKGRKLLLALEKTVAILLTTKRKLAPIVFHVVGTNITPDKSFRYLSVSLDTKLSYELHALPEHAFFGKYRERAGTKCFTYCPDVDDAVYTFFKCPR